MPETVAQQYFPVLLQIGLAVVMAVGLVATGLLVGKRVRSQVKEMPYECGITPTGTARERFSVKFYLVAMLFILFDIEAVFLYPWAVVFRELKWVAFVEMILFMILILSGFFYIWKKGALNWTVEETSRQHLPRRGPETVDQMVQAGLLEPVSGRETVSR